MNHTVTRLYLVRHGETDANKEGVLAGSTDIPLNATGRLQATSLAERLKGLQVETLYSSPLQRATETATTVFGTDRPIITDTSLQECHFGEWEGKHFTQIEKEYPDLWQLWLTHWDKVKIPRAEEFAAFSQRVTSFVDELVRQHPGGRLALVSHGGCMRVLLAHLFSSSVAEGYWQFRVDNAALTEVQFMGDLPILARFNYC